MRSQRLLFTASVIAAGSLALTTVLLITGTVIMSVTAHEAVAKDPGGLYFENATSAGGFSVRKVRDTSNGVVCYVARGPAAIGNVREAFSVGVSCLKE